MPLTYWHEKLDLPVLGVINAVAWFANIEEALKLALLVVSIGYAVHRWWRFARAPRRNRHRIYDNE